MIKALKTLKRAIQAIMLALLAFVVLVLTSCGMVVEYQTSSGIVISETIDGKINPRISTRKLNLNDWINR